MGFVCGVALLLKRPSVCIGFPRLTIGAQEAVAVVNLYGPIYVSEGSSLGGFPRGSDLIVRKLHRLNERKEVKAVVLRINSPGGSVAAVQEITREIELLKKNKKIVVASMGDIAASGGYYVASQADVIVADPGTLTGSIGVIMQVANVQELFRKIGVRMETVKTGKFKDIGSPFRELSAQERDLFEKLINEAYKQFVGAVVDGRKLDRAKVLELADGRIFTGTQAKEAGLVDEFGNFQDSIRLAAAKAGIKGKPRVIYDSDSISWLLQLLAESSDVKVMSEMLARKKVRLDYMLE